MGVIDICLAAWRLAKDGRPKNLSLAKMVWNETKWLADGLLEKASERTISYAITRMVMP